MAVNIEIKARVRDVGKLQRLLPNLSDAPGEVMIQEDTFFHTPKGRLKLRTLAPDHGELIYYERDNIAGPKPSTYLISTSSDPGSLKALLTAALGVRGIVRKQRQLYRAGNTRIHLDTVEGLGVFLEVEVVLNPGQSPAEGESVALELMRQLGIETTDFVEEAYMDLLEKGRTLPRFE